MKSSIFLNNKSAVLFMPPSSPDNLPRDEVQLHNPLCNIMSNQRDSHFDTKSIIHSIYFLWIKHFMGFSYSHQWQWLALPKKICVSYFQLVYLIILISSCGTHTHPEKLAWKYHFELSTHCNSTFTIQSNIIISTILVFPIANIKSTPL